MAIFDQYIAIKKETTYGTAVTPDVMIEGKSEDWSLDLDMRENQGFRPNKQGVHEDHYRVATLGATGSIETCLWRSNVSKLLEGCFGSAASTVLATQAGAYEHVYKMTDAASDAHYTIQVGRADASGTIRPSTYESCKATGFSLGCSVGDDPMLTVRYDSNKENMTTAAITATNPPDTQPYIWEDFEISWNGTKVENLTGFQIEADLGLKTDLQYLDGDSNKAEPVRNTLPNFTVTLDGHWTSALSSIYQHAASGSTDSLKIEAEMPAVIAGTTQYSFEIDFPAVVPTGGTPNMSMDDLTSISLPLKVLWNGSALATLKMVTDEASI